MKLRPPSSGIAFDAPAFEKMRAALTQKWGCDAAYVEGCDPLPVNRELKSALGMDVILAGFALDDDRIHSPHEKYNLETVHRGMRFWVRVLKVRNEA